MARWAGDAGAKPASPMRLINARRYPLDRDGELLVQMYESVAEDESAVAGARTSVTKRRVVFTTDAAEELVLHWGVARDEPGQWLLPEPDVWPAETTAVSEISVETPLVAGLGCLPTAAAAATQAPGAAVAEEDKECYPLQMLSLDLPGSGAEELMGVQFVLRNADGTIWFKDQTNGNSNFRANFAAPGSDTSDELLDAIIRAEAGGGWWTLMHRFNLASALLEQKCSPAAEKSPSAAALAAAKIYVWLRYSAQRKLTWQRNYNVKPRELSSAQSRLTRVVSQLYCDSPSLRDVTRLMLGTVGKGGEGGQGQQIRDEILNIMHRNGIGEQKGIWMEQWHQKLHNNTTPDDIIICEAYLAFLKSDMNLAEYWRVLGEGGITRERLESYERPIVTEPLPRPTIKMALIKDFTNYLAILKSVHSGADLVECIRACARGLGGVSPALNYVRVAQGGGGDPAQLLAACVEREAPAPRRRPRVRLRSGVDQGAPLPRPGDRRRRSSRGGALGGGELRSGRPDGVRRVGVGEPGALPAVEQRGRRPGAHRVAPRDGRETVRGRELGASRQGGGRPRAFGGGAARGRDGDGDAARGDENRRGVRHRVVVRGPLRRGGDPRRPRVRAQPRALAPGPRAQGGG